MPLVPASAPSATARAPCQSPRSVATATRSPRPPPPSNSAPDAAAFVTAPQNASAPTGANTNRHAMWLEIGRCKSDGVRAIPFDHVFGGLFSLLQADGFKRHGRGMLLCELSCAAEQFCIPKDVGRPVHRRIRSTYVPASGLAALGSRWAQVGPSPGPLGQLLDMVQQFVPRDFPVHRQMFYIVVASPFDLVDKFRLYLMMNWHSMFYRDTMAKNELRHEKQTCLELEEDGTLQPPLGLLVRLRDNRRVASWASCRSRPSMDRSLRIRILFSRSTSHPPSLPPH
ncbi:hypothetical protein BDK51DRAFT_46009 [Blyttiomyces helicus]|uniref:Uncharacterized protein n=1 Tax=Blyttiomyces helicus TaxID=388810 RepID=A0A4P9WEK6_9FUNG|nr:hypothetical protein BDK51DRAFT_46009 [Blyttiomyces helicus]|eukprot:RKO91161.1 hypothetical protein BDK51DRAFT_46009 [Blyttiomyces helicus]